MVHSEFDCQFFGNSILAPFRMIGAYATNQGNVFLWNWRTSRFAGTPTPIALEAAPMPSDYSCRVDKYQS
jgi:hypothetical protein